MKKNKENNLDLLGTMSASLIHEINNPVAAISARLELIKSYVKKDNLDKDKLLNEIETINQKISKITSIVSTIKDLSRVNDEIEFSPFLLEDVKNKLSNELNVLASESKVKIHWELNDEIYFYIIFSGLIGFFIWNEMPDLLSIIGYLFIISSYYYLIRFQNRSLSHTDNK